MATNIPPCSSFTCFDAWIKPKSYLKMIDGDQCIFDGHLFDTVEIPNSIPSHCTIRHSTSCKYYVAPQPTPVAAPATQKEEPSHIVAYLVAILFSMTLLAIGVGGPLHFLPLAPTIGYSMIGLGGTGILATLNLAMCKGYKSVGHHPRSD